MIEPNIGRVVWYWPAPHEIRGVGGDMAQVYGDQPMKADIVAIHGDRMVNLFVVDHTGVSHARSSVQLLQDNDPKPQAGMAYCEWMPYQKKVAAGEIEPMKHATRKRGG